MAATALRASSLAIHRLTVGNVDSSAQLGGHDKLTLTNIFTTSHMHVFGSGRCICSGAISNTAILRLREMRGDRRRFAWAHRLHALKLSDKLKSAQCVPEATIEI